VTAEVVRQVAILVKPVMPQSARKLLDLLAQPDDARAFKALGEAGRLVPGTVLPEPAGVFPRYIAVDQTLADLTQVATATVSPSAGTKGSGGKRKGKETEKKP